MKTLSKFCILSNQYLNLEKKNWTVALYQEMM